jgi:hypothetical protein
MLTLEQSQYLQTILEQLSHEDQQNLLQMLYSREKLSQEDQEKLRKILYSKKNTMRQFNSDQVKGYQLEANDSNVNIDNRSLIINHHHHYPSLAFEDAIEEVFANGENYDFYSADCEDEDTLEYPVGNYANTYGWGRSDHFSEIGFGPILIVGAVAVCGIGAFLSGIGSKTAVVRTPPNLSAAHVKDDSANIKESLANGTVVHLTGKRDGNYCGTDHGWIYCPYLAENNLEKPALPSPPSSPGGTISSAQTAIVQPDSDKKAANLRAQPNAGQVISQVLKGEKVQVIRCTEDGCEVRHGSMQGWIYKPFLHFSN